MSQSRHPVDEIQIKQTPGLIHAIIGYQHFANPEISLAYVMVLVVATMPLLDVSSLLA